MSEHVGWEAALDEEMRTVRAIYDRLGQLDRAGLCREAVRGVDKYTRSIARDPLADMEASA